MGGTDTATVLFADLVGSTELRVRVGDESADTVRRLVDELLAEAVARHGGTRVKSLGDGCMAAFGSASDGVAAAVAIQQSVHRHNVRAAGERLSVRIGVSTGDVVWEDGDCFGVPVIEAARLCAAAAGDQILSADVVRLLARSRGGFTFEPAGELVLKGLPHAVPACTVAWEPLEPAGTDALPMPELLDSGTRLGFAGRSHELETLFAAWKQALSGERQAVLLAGEPGIGKTRLAREVALCAHEQGAVVLYGRCEEDLGAPYQPFVEALDFFLTQAPTDGLSSRLGRYPAELSRLCPVVDSLVPGLAPPLRSDAETERYRLFEAVAGWLVAAADPHGLVLVLDDLHWATRPTLVLLQHLLHASAQSRMLVLGTYRDTDLDRMHPLAGLLADLRRHPGVRRVALSGLDLAGVTQLLTDAAGHELDDEGAALARAIRDETEGNPFFVGEILRHLRESGAVVERHGRWTSDLDTSELGIPEGIREVVGRRLDRLRPVANKALSTAAVVGRDFDLSIVSGAAELAEEDVLGALDEAVTARLVEETGVGRYRFAHALVRSTLYEELRPTRRARLHARVGLLMESQGRADSTALAHHFAQAGDAGDVERALRYSRLAGDDAMQQLAHDRAVDYYRQALELLDDDPGREPARCALQVALGEAQRRSGDPAYRRTLLGAAALAERIGSAEQLVRAALANTRGFWSMAGEVDTERMAVIEAALAAVGDAESADRARLLGILAAELMFTTEDERRHALSDEAIWLARRVGDLLALTDVLMWSVPANYVPWRMEVLLRNSDELMEIAATLEDPQRWALSNLWNFIAHAASGDRATAEERLAVANHMADDLGQPTLRWLTASWTTFLVLLDGDLDEAARHLDAAFELGQRTGQPDAFTWYAAQLWVLVWERGELPSLLDVVCTQVERNPGLPAWQNVLGLIYCVTGQLDEAQSVLDRLTPGGVLDVARDVMWLCTPAALLEIAECVGDGGTAAVLYDELLPYRHLPVHGGVAYLGSAELYLACGARTTGRLDDAVAHLEAAVAFEERMRARTWLGVACADLALTLRLRGDPVDAARADELIGRALALADETGSVRVARRVEGRPG